MEVKEFVKPVVLLFLYGFAAPLLGLFIVGRRRVQRGVFAAMCFMTISGLLTAGEWGLTIGFDENYRGHSRGYHFFFNEILAFALIVAARADRRDFRLLPPGTWIYFLYCGMCLLSVLNSVVPNYTLMAGFKALKVIVIFIAGFNFVRSDRDLHFFLRVMSLTMIWQMIVVLKMKYLDGMYQVRGTFEHQNSLAMYATLISMVLLAVGAGPGHHRSKLYLAGFLACAVAVQATLSRAGLVVFAFGTTVVLVMSLLDRVTWRRVMVGAALSVVAVIGLSMTLDTIIARFQDNFNVGSNVTREMLNHASREMVKDHPLGIGWNNYAVVINRPYRYGDIIDDFSLSIGHRIDPDERKGIEESHYYLMLAETGFQGLLAYLALIGLFLYWNARSAWFFRHQFLGALSLGIMTGCGLNYLHGAFERVLTQPRNMMLWLLLLAITARIEMWRRTEVGRRRLDREQAGQAGVRAGRELELRA